MELIINLLKYSLPILFIANISHATYWYARANPDPDGPCFVFVEETFPVPIVASMHEIDITTWTNNILAEYIMDNTNLTWTTNHVLSDTAPYGTNWLVEGGGSASPAVRATTNNSTYGTNYYHVFDGNGTSTGDRLVSTNLHSITGAVPRAIMGWVRADVTNVQNCAFALGCSTTSPQKKQFFISNSGAGAKYWTCNVYGAEVGATNNVGWVTTNWTHVVGSYDGTNLYVYVNGTNCGQVAEAIDTGRTHGYSIGACNISGVNWYYHFNGAIDDVRFFNRHVTPSETATIITRTSGKYY